MKLSKNISFYFYFIFLQRQRTSCAHAKKHSPGCGRTCCPCPKKDALPQHNCNCKSMSRERNGAPRPGSADSVIRITINFSKFKNNFLETSEPEKYSQRNPCANTNRPRTCGSGNMRYEQTDLGSHHRDFNNQVIQLKVD